MSTRVPFLSPEWVAAVRDLTISAQHPPTPGATARFQYRITGGPEGTVENYWEDTVDGQLKVLELGEIQDPDFVLNADYATWKAVRKGDMSFWDAVAVERIRVDGDVEVFRALARVRDVPHYAEHARKVRALTAW